MTFEPWEWALLIIGATTIGLSKSGIPGLGILFVAIMQVVLPGKGATGLMLPLLIVGDVFAVLTYRRHTEWPHVLRLFPWTAAGVIAGYFALRVIDNRETTILVGIILLGMLALHAWRNRKSAAGKIEKEVAENAAWFAPMSGVLAGFTTQIANAAGPVMILYLLAMRLPKMAFLGTAAVFFMALNLFKVPFMLNLEMITRESLVVNLWLAPAVALGSLGGWLLAGRIPQKLFERIALLLTLAAAIKLLWDAFSQ